MSSARLISRLKALNWDFEGAGSESAFSSIHWHPCRFVSQIPAALIGLLSRPSAVVADPFLGSGTTAVEAQRLGRHFVGFEINPTAALISDAKVLPVTGRHVSRLCRTLKASAQESVRAGVLSPERVLEFAPDGVQLEKWYVAGVAAELCALWWDINATKGTARAIALLAFSSILLKVCRETRHWGYVCDNSTPVGNRGGDVLLEYSRALDAIARAYEERDIHLRDLNAEIFPAIVHCADARDGLAQLHEGSVDLVVTSPPYFGVSDYAKAQRLTAEWLSTDIESIRRAEIGARSKRHRLAAYHEYMQAMEFVFRGCHRALKKDGYCCVVLGESSARSGYIDDFRKRMLEMEFLLEHETTRRISVRRRQNPSLHEEHLFVFRR